MKPPSILLLRRFSPFWPSKSRQCLAQTINERKYPDAQIACFSATARQFKKKQVTKKDRKVSAIRYFLNHPLTPRPLRFSRLRFLRHWTIHRAWQLYQAKLREKKKTERYQQYQSMANACELLRNMDDAGFTVEERAKLGMAPAPDNSVGHLYRVAMQKSRVWTDIPIEYARIQTETPSKVGWNHEWKR